jgi:thiamine pyrophosphate-dependent acetolactate synthase large subunit-like protein
MEVGSTNSPSETESGSEARVSIRVAQALIGRGVEVIFGLVGHTNYRLMADYVQLGGRYVAMRHESGAVAAADAYARLTGAVGVATVTQGPGLSNAATPLVEARKAHTPLLLIAGDTVSGVEDNQDFDQDAFARSLGIEAARPSSAATAASATVAAFDLARERHQPVLMSLPQDVQAAMVKEARVASLAVLVRSEPEAGQLEAAVQRLLQARRPLVIAGRGSLISDAGPALAALAERLGAPLATTAQAHGLFSGNPLSLGVCGGYTSPEAWKVMCSADLIVAVGASLTKWTTRGGELLADADIMHIDVEARGDYAVTGDANLAATALLEALQERNHSADPWAGKVQESLPLDCGDEAGMDPAIATMTLNSVLPKDRMVVLDSGHHIGWPVRHLEVPNERSWVFAQGFQSVGLGLPGSVGASQVHPGRLVVSVIGDGGLAMSLGELDSIVRAKSPILVVVYDDRAYGAELHRFQAAGVTAHLSQFDRIDFAAVARAVGAGSATVDQPEDILPALSDWLAEPSGAFLVQMRISPNVRGPWMDKGAEYQSLQKHWAELEVQRKQ